jgi:hypothetical protein
MTLQTSGSISIGDIATEFEDTAPHSMSEFYDAGGAPSSGALSISDFYGLSNIVKAPIGLIIPTTSASTPSGWTSFTSANDRFIVAAGSSYSAGSTGGSSSVSVSSSVSNTGSHTGSDQNTSLPALYGENAAGAHSHNYSASGSGTDVYKNFRLLKATAESAIPANGILLASTTISGLTNVETSTDRFLRAAATAGGTGGSTSVNLSGTTSSSGSHTHPGGSGNGAGETGGYNHNVARYNFSAFGAHTHSVALSGSFNTKRIYMSAWTNATAEFGILPNTIAMWESATPPSGWAICNGGSGTPDMRDHFVRIGTTANHGSKSGTNSMSFSGSTSGTPSHSHMNSGNFGSSYRAGRKHGSYSWSHTHNTSPSATVVPPYYGLYFIMYTG